jgi:hypothetical protein
MVPLKSDCWLDYGPSKGYLVAWGQVASLAALHRMLSFTTQFFAHMDVDEFFVTKECTVLDMIMTTNNNHDDSIDALRWIPTHMAPRQATCLIP